MKNLAAFNKASCKIGKIYRGWVIFVAVLSMQVSLSFAATRGPDGGGYTGTDATVYSFLDISGANGGASILAGADDDLSALKLPFAFTFYGQAYSMICVSSNGVLYFVADLNECAGVNDFANLDLTQSTPPFNRPALLPFWSDLTFQVAGGGSVYYQSLGTTGNRRFVVEWKNAYPQGSANPVTFQAILSEEGNKILFQYQTVDLGTGNPASKGGQATIGIRDAGGGNQQIQWSYAASVIGNDSAISFSIDLCALNTTSSIMISPSGLRRNAGTGRWVQTVSLRNAGSTPVAGPLSLVLDNLSSNATLFMPVGITTCSAPLGTSYANANLGATNILSPGQTSNLTLEFANPQNQGITYNARVLAGPGSR